MHGATQGAQDCECHRIHEMNNFPTNIFFEWIQKGI